MSSKTILIGLGIFRCGCERSLHGRPSFELAPYFPELRTAKKDCTVWCGEVATNAIVNMSALESVKRFVLRLSSLF